MALALGNSDISNELWQSALGTLERNFSKPVFEMWIKPMRFVSYRGNELHLAVHSKFAREWVGTKLQARSSTSCASSSAASSSCVFRVAEAERRRRRSGGVARHAPARRPQNRQPQPPLHVRRIRRRQFQPVRPRRLAGGRQRPGTRLQSAVPLRRRRTGQDPPDARDRSPRACSTIPSANVVYVSTARSSPTNSSSRCKTTGRPSFATATATSTCC